MNLMLIPIHTCACQERNAYMHQPYLSVAKAGPMDLVHTLANRLLHNHVKLFASTGL